MSLQVRKQFSRGSSGIRSSYEFKFPDGTMVYAGNNNAGQRGGIWKVCYGTAKNKSISLPLIFTKSKHPLTLQIKCYRQGHDLATESPHQEHDLDSKTLRKVRNAFKKFDKDGSGTITTGGAYAALTKIFPASTLPNYESTLEAESIRAIGDDKVVDLDEFECVARKLFNIQKVYLEFKQYDKNNDLKMDRKELESALIKFYFKDVAQPGLIQTAAARVEVDSVVDDIIKTHDKDHDESVSWSEFEMDAFMEENYKPNAKCQTSTTPLNSHEVAVVTNLVQKFQKNESNEGLSHSEWYQVISMLTVQSIATMSVTVEQPALGCLNQNNNKHATHQHASGSGSGPVGHYFGQNGGNRFGIGRDSRGGTRLGGRVLLRRFLYSAAKKPTKKKVQKNNKNKKNKKKKVNPKKMSIKDALAALHDQADTNSDGKISDHEILDIFQGVRDHLTISDFGSFLDMVNKLDGPVDCDGYDDCDTCTAVDNAGLCGWFASSTSSTFGGYVQNKGTCKFVDRSQHGSKDVLTCSTQCKRPHFRHPHTR